MAYQNLDFKASASAVGSIDEAQGIVDCIVAVIGNRDSVKDIILPGAFDASLRRRKPRAVWGHDWNQPIGKVLDIYEVRSTDPRLPQQLREKGFGGLFARVQFNLQSERGREAFSMVTFFGADQEWSIGYKTLDAVFDAARDANLLKELELFEVSPVLHGANQLTMTLSVKDGKDGQANPATGRGAILTRALSEHWGLPVKLRDVEGTDVVFDVLADNETQTFKCGVMFADHGIFFGNAAPHEVDDDDDDDENAPSPGIQAQLAFVRQRMMAAGAPKGTEAKDPDDDEPAAAGSCGCGGTCGGGKSAEGELDTKVGRVLSSRNLNRLKQAADLLGEVLTSSGFEPTATKEKSLVDQWADVKDAAGDGSVVLVEPATWSGVQLKFDSIHTTTLLDLYEPLVKELGVGLAASESSIHLFLPYADQADLYVEALSDVVVGRDDLGDTVAYMADDEQGDRPGSELVLA